MRSGKNTGKNNEAESENQERGRWRTRLYFIRKTLPNRDLTNFAILAIKQSRHAVLSGGTTKNKDARNLAGLYYIEEGGEMKKRGSNLKDLLLRNFKNRRVKDAR